MRWFGLAALSGSFVQPSLVKTWTHAIAISGASKALWTLVSKSVPRNLPEKNKTILTLLFGFGLLFSSSRTLAQSGTWSTRTSEPETRIESTGASIGGVFYVFGGSNDNGASALPEVYDPRIDGWVFKAPDPIPRALASAQAINNKIYLAEGWINADSGASTNAMHIYNPATNTWTTGAASLFARGAVASAVVGGKLYITGGVTGNNVAHNDLEIYDPLTDSWSAGAAEPVPIGYSAGVAINGKFYVVGGAANVTPTGALRIYDPGTNTWTNGPAMPTPRGGLIAGLVDGKLYAVGGFVLGGAATSTVEVYDPASNAWTTGPSAPTARQLGAGTVVNSRLYVTGGYNAAGSAIGTLDVFTPVGAPTPTPIPTPTPSPTPTPLGSPTPPPPPVVIANPREFNFLSINEAFAPGAASPWTTKASMPTPRDAMSVSVVNGKIYVAGGQLFNDCTPVGTLEAYDPATDTWVTGLVPMPLPYRWAAGAGTINGKMYVVGGELGCGPAVKTVTAYDPLTGQWTTGLQDMPTARHSMGIAVIHDGTLNRDVLYAIGGTANTGINFPVKTVERYDPVTNTWTSKAPMLQERFRPVVGVVNGKIYAIGGADVTFNQPPLHTVEEYDPVANTWTLKAPMPTARGLTPAGGVIANIIYVIGGNDQGAAVETQLATVEAYDPSTNIWSTAPEMLTARKSLEVAVVNNTLYALGGFKSEAATMGQPFVYQITATNHPTSYAASGLPPGLNRDVGLGLIYGTPNTAIDPTVTLTAENQSASGFAPLRLTVHAPPPSGLQIVNSTCATGRTGIPFNFQLLTTGGSPARRFGLTGLPSGLGVDAVTGLISGTPTFGGNFGVTVSAIDGAVKATAVLQLTFVSDPTVPIITSGDIAILTPGQNFSYTMTADPPDGTFGYIGTDGTVHQGATCVGLPAGLCFDGINRIYGCFNPPCGLVSPRTLRNTKVVDRYVTGGSRKILGISENMVTNVPFPPNNPNSFAPDTITIRPPLHSICQPFGNNESGTGTRPLNFFVGYTITLNASPESAGAVNGIYNQDSTVTVTATANSGFIFANWTDENGLASTFASYSFTATRNRVLTANFTPPHPAFFAGEIALGNGVYYLQFANGTPFGYYSYLSDPRVIYHFDMGYEYLFDANDGQSGIFFYDFASSTFFYAGPTFPFPYLYDFSLNTILYYYPDTNNPGHYTTNPRYFYDFATGQIITK